MATTTEPIHPDGRRTGAIWVAATGAFLLLAAAGVFVAGRWHQLPDAAKLALVGALTGACMVTGRALRRTLPGTGDVIFHLGAFLVPVDVGGICAHAHLGWREVLVAEGIACTAVFGGLGVTTRSVVLKWAGAASMILLSLGLAAVSPIAAPLALAVVALLASAFGYQRPAVWWAAVAGFAPVLGAVAKTVIWVCSPHAHVGYGVLGELGVVGAAAVPSVTAGVVAAFVLARAAHRERSAPLALVALGSLATAVIATWAASDFPARADTLVLPAVFLLVEMATAATARDSFWSPLATTLATAVEALATLAAVGTSVFVTAAMFGFGDPYQSVDPVGALSFVLFALGWAVCSARLGETNWSGSVVATVGTAAALGAAISVSGMPPAVAALCGLVIGAAAYLTRRPGHGLVIAAAAVWAPVVAWSLPGWSAAAAVLGCALCVQTASRYLSMHTDNGLTSGVAVLLAAGAAAVLAGVALEPMLGLTGAVMVAIGMLWTTAARLDLAEPIVAEVVRWSTLVALLAVADRPAQEVLAAALLVGGLLAVDAVRHDEPRIGFAASIAGQVVVATTALASGLSAAEAGVALCVSAVVWAGLAAIADDRWQPVFVGASVLALVHGLGISVARPVTFAIALMISGGVVIGGGMVLRSMVVQHVGGGVAVAGFVLYLVHSQVGAAEPYLAPVALQLLVLGMQLRARERVSSWAAYTPSIALLGGAALVERWTGGASWHALVAGGVGVVAVAAGGGKRLAGPLFSGTGLVVGVTIYESLSVAAGIPTSVWLASGGALLLGIAVCLERAATSPLEAGRRLVDVIGERFE